jgi:hypothetical protein
MYHGVMVFDDPDKLDVYWMRGVSLCLRCDNSRKHSIRDGVQKISKVLPI